VHTTIEAVIAERFGEPGEMRGDDEAAFEPGLARSVEAQQLGHRLDRRLDRQHVEPRGSDVSALQMRQQRVEIEDRAARVVDYDRTRA
jgi:hypothetical protein